MEEQDLAARLLAWHYNDAEDHRADLEGLLEELPPAPEEVIRLVRVREELRDVRNTLDYYRLHPDAMPDHEAVEHAQGVAGRLKEKEQRLETYFQGSIDRFSALALQQGLTPEEMHGRFADFAQAKALMRHYDPGSSERLDTLERQVREAVDSRLLSQDRQIRFSLPYRQAFPQGKTDKNYRALQRRFERLREEFQEVEDGEHTRQTRGTLKRIIRKLNHVAVDAATHGYDFAHEAQATVSAALDEYERSESDASSRFWKRATLGVGAVTLALVASIGALRYAGTQHLIAALEASRKAQPVATQPVRQAAPPSASAPAPATRAVAPRPVVPLPIRTVQHVKAERPWLAYAAYFSRDGHEMTLYDLTGGAPQEVFQARCIYGSTPGDKERAGDHRTQEGVFSFEDGAIGDFAPLYGKAFLNLEDRPYAGLQITGISLPERFRAWERDEDATNGAAALLNKDAVRLVGYALRHGLGRGVAIIEDSARPLYRGLRHAA